MSLQYPNEEQIRARAYELYQQRGGDHGHHMDDWLQAEYELAQLPVRHLAKMAKSKPKAQPRSKSLLPVVATALLLSTQMMPGMK